MKRAWIQKQADITRKNKGFESYKISENINDDSKEYPYLYKFKKHLKGDWKE